MQFSHNADYPGVDSHTGQPIPAPSQPPAAFPAVAPHPCARITTRVCRPDTGATETVPHVLVRTARPRMRRPRDEDDDAMSSSSSSSSSSSASSDDDDDPHNTTTEPQTAYWIQRVVREAIYGRVWLATVLQRQSASVWIVTDTKCAVKEMSWQHIRKERDRLAEDPVKEVSAMQYLYTWYTTTTAAAATVHGNKCNADQAMRATNIVMPLDLLSDERNLYSVMPYCDGGELFERLDQAERFSEPEARYWMNQVLNGLEHLQRSGICHRDISLENLLVHQSGALIIDMGMCLRVPIAEVAADGGVTQQMQGLVLNNSTVPQQQQQLLQQQQQQQQPTLSPSSPTRQRFLIQPQSTCGKWIYMSPEIYQNREPFDGFAVDMWAAGVILFLMLTGFPPWERACLTDDRFKYMSQGYLVQMLTEWDLGLSSDAMDLLQRMMFLDPKDRLCLAQVRAHPWMTNGAMAATSSSTL